MLGNSLLGKPCLRPFENFSYNHVAIAPHASRLLSARVSCPKQRRALRQDNSSRAEVAALATRHGGSPAHGIHAAAWNFKLPCHRGRSSRAFMCHCSNSAAERRTGHRALVADLDVEAHNSSSGGSGSPGSSYSSSRGSSHDSSNSSSSRDDNSNSSSHDSAHSSSSSSSGSHIIYHSDAGSINAQGTQSEQPASQSAQKSSTVASVQLPMPRRSLQVSFTCNLCGERTQRKCNPVAWKQGMVMAKCSGCDKWHKLADEGNLVDEIRYIDERIEAQAAKDGGQ